MANSAERGAAAALAVELTKAAITSGNNELTSQIIIDEWRTVYRAILAEVAEPQPPDPVCAACGKGFSVGEVAVDMEGTLYHSECSPWKPGDSL